MINRYLYNRFRRKNRSGIVLLVTMVLLVVISMLGYVLTSRVAAQRYRNRYLVDYQTARYACDSAVKYALAAMEDINAPLISRPNEPDFSDLFHLSEQEYEKLLADWAEGKFSKKSDKSIKDANSPKDTNSPKDANSTKDANALRDFNSIRDANVIKSPANDANFVKDINRPARSGAAGGDFNEPNKPEGPNEPNSLTIRGPYGPPWPLVTKPAEFKIGDANVRIEVEDENAKYPLGWTLLGDDSVQDESAASFETFCEWMGFNFEEIDSLKQDLKKIREFKSFKMKFETVFEGKPVKTRVVGRSGELRTGTVTRAVAPSSVHIADFAKIFHSSFINTELLARPTIISTVRKESAMKYIGTWASNRVNVNTAPRNVLEAAFSFGGNAPKVADQIIQRRRLNPFTNLDDLRKAVFKYSDSIKKSEKYITTASSFFTIKVTAVSGLSTVSAVIAVTKNGNTIERIGIISE